MFNDDDHLSSNRDSVIINDSAIFYQWLEEKVTILQFSIQLIIFLHF